MRAVGLLSVLKFKNSLRTLFTDPRKLIVLVIVVFYIVMMAWFVSMTSNRTQMKPLFGAIDPILLRAGIMFAMMIVSSAVIDMGLGDGLLVFGMSDVDYLFSSPISRRVVLVYKLPSLLFQALLYGGLLLFVLSMVRVYFSSTLPPVPGWMKILAMTFCVGTYLNLGMFVAIRFKNRKLLHKILLGLVVAVIVAISIVGWQYGLLYTAKIVLSEPLRWLFLPASLATEVLSNEPHAALVWLGVSFCLSLVPMFATNSNFYEQSIASSERVSTFRKAAKGGYATLMAAKSTSYKHKGTNPYTFKPFGQGWVALLWAHLCAAGKKSSTNFVSPLLIGIVTGAVSAAGNFSNHGFGFVPLGILCFYASMLFMASAKTSSESAVRRRELLSPLPIAGWQSVIANLGVPLVSVMLFCLGVGITYGISGAEEAALVAVAVIMMLPLRMANRMVLQYLVVIGYPDFADKVQQLMGMVVYSLFTMPFLIIEFVACVPGILLQSLWLGLVCLILVQIPVLWLLVLLAGKASDRAVATGEPVKIMRLIRGRA